MKSFLIASLACLMLAGCSDVRPLVEGRQDPYKPAQIHFDTDTIRRDTAVGQPIVTRDESGILHVQVPIRSALNKTLYIDYRVTFFDRNGQTLETLGWFNKTFEPNTPDTISVNSTSTRAADFQVDFRYAK